MSSKAYVDTTLMLVDCEVTSYSGGRSPHSIFLAIMNGLELSQLTVVEVKFDINLSQIKKIHWGASSLTTSLCT